MASQVKGIKEIHNISTPKTHHRLMSLPEWKFDKYTQNYPCLAIAAQLSFALIFYDFWFYMSAKTRKSVAKRFKVTASGRFKRRSPGMRHLLSAKSSKRRRKLGLGAMVHPSDEQRVIQSLPYSH
jgi:large subunit ribosomal protein L35